MKKKNIRDIILGCFLISSLSVATFIVSCSDQNGIDSIFSSTDRGSPYHQHIHGKREATSSAITSTFSQIGQGAAQELGEVGMGWALSAMGMTGASGPDWEAEFATINNDLNQIIGLLTEADQELATIDSVLQVMNCSIQQTSLQNDIGAIINEYAVYNTLMKTASEGDTALYQASSEFVNNVLNGKGSQPSITLALATIQANVNTGNGAIISCMQPIPKPSNVGFRGDSVYYVSAQSLLNYYYYYQTIGLGLISEAYHWQAWADAGAPGAGSGYSADSIQLVCNDQYALLQCNYVVTQTNDLYNSLLLSFKQVGAPYTGEDLLYQINTIGETVVWVRSLEDYTEQSGASCTYPLSQNNLCGPAVGKFGSTLSVTTYYGTQNFTFPSLKELKGLVTPLPQTSQTIGYFLDSLGFENMNVDPPKVLIADTLVKIQSDVNNGYYFLDTMHIIPYINPSGPVFLNYNNNKRAIYDTTGDFVSGAMHAYAYQYISNGPCQNEYAGNAIEVFWECNVLPSPWDYCDQGIQQICEVPQGYGSPTKYEAIAPFSWNTKGPGWSYYQSGSQPQNAFFIPVKTNFSGTTGCLTGYSNSNVAGFITMCAGDFQNYLNLNLLRPPTCNIPNSPPCTSLP